MKQIQKITGCFLFVASLLLWTTSASAQCQTDNDCKGDRVCNQGTCGPASCTKDTDCPGDLVCSPSGVCSNVTPAPAPAAATPPPVAVAPQAPAPVPMRKEKKRIKGLLIAGPIILGVTWLSTIGITAAVSAGTESSRTDTNIAYAAIPVVGPFVLLGDGDRDTDEFTGPLVLSGILQMGGLTMTILGATITREVTVPATALGEGVPTRSRLTLSPGIVGNSGAGVNLQVGSF